MNYVIGNSHADMFYNDNRFIVVTGNINAGLTAHNLNKKNSTSNSYRILMELANRIDKKNDIIILAGYGEVDCRIHIYYQYKKNNEKITVTQLIDNTVHNFCSVMQELKDMGIRFYIIGIPPAGHEKNLYNYPWYATPEIHCNIYREFNQRLRDFCNKKGYRYLDIYARTVDDNGFIKQEFALDDVHLNDNAKLIIMEILKEFKENI